MYIVPDDCRPSTEPPAKTIEKENAGPLEAKEEEDDDEPVTGSPLLVIAELLRALVQVKVKVKLFI